MYADIFTVFDNNNNNLLFIMINSQIHNSIYSNKNSNNNINIF